MIRRGIFPEPKAMTVQIIKVEYIECDYMQIWRYNFKEYCRRLFLLHQNYLHLHEKYC